MARLGQTSNSPTARSLIPGVVTHHTLTVEHPRLVADRLVRYARLLGRENVIGGTDCGFQQGSGVQRVHPTVMWAKLRALADGARLATPGALARLAPQACKLRTRVRLRPAPALASASRLRCPGVRPCAFAHSSCGTIQNTSNSLPSGSCAYRLRLEPWSFTPTSAFAAISVSRALASSGSVSTCQARWYRPTRSPRVGSGAFGPMLNSPRSWLLSVFALVLRK